MEDYKMYYKILRHFKTIIPYNFSVRRVNMKKLDGDCAFIKDKFIIRIEKSLPAHNAIDVLVHELAHILSWETEKDIHGPNWGKAYSYVYRQLLKIDLQS